VDNKISKVLPVTLKNELYNQLKLQAEKEGRSLSNLISIALKKYLEERGN
jgi:metal-responsive CopG/Arc/MetJ family transcriptional regulator